MELWVFTNVMQILLALIALIGVVITGYHVFKIIRFTNKLILSLMVFLGLSMLNCMIIAIVNIKDHMHDDEDHRHWEGDFRFFDEMNPALFSITIFINLRLWLNHLLKIEEQVSVTNHMNLKRKLDIVFCLIIAGKMVLSLFQWTVGIVEQDLEAFNFARLFVFGIEYCFIGVFELILGVSINEKLRIFFP